jgi:hypothetical protein
MSPASKRALAVGAVASVAYDLGYVLGAFAEHANAWYVAPITQLVILAAYALLFALADPSEPEETPPK